MKADSKLMLSAFLFIDSFTFNKFIKMKTSILFLLILFISINLQAKKKGKRIMSSPATYDFIIADVDAYEVVRYSKYGERLWVYSDVRAIDVWMLSNDDVLIAYLPSELTANKGGVRIVNSEMETVMDYQIDDEVMSCCILPNGNILFTETKAGKLSELSREGELIRSFDIIAKGMGHKTVRFIRLTPDNTILAAECYSHIVREYSLVGKFIRDFDLTMAYSAYRLENGNTLISGYHPPKVIEVNSDGETVWELLPKDLPETKGIKNFCEAQRLPNGNTLITNSIREFGKNNTVLFEITPDKKIVWQLRDSKRIKGITAVKPIF